MEYTQPFCKISHPNRERSIYQMRKGQHLVRIGRARGDEPNDIELGPNNCGCISRLHCLLVKKDEKWWLIRKGKYFPLIKRKTDSWEEVHTEVQLADGDLISILGEKSTKGEISWIIRFCDGETTQPVLTTAFLRYDKQQRTLFRVEKGGEQLIPLSSQERDLADFMLKHPGHIFSQEELIEAIWRDDMSKNVGSLRNLIYRLRTKIEPSGTRERFLIAHPASGYSLHTRPQ